jgi:O-6-methylguanine DNA methyltransferase
MMTFLPEQTAYLETPFGLMLAKLCDTGLKSLDFIPLAPSQTAPPPPLSPQAQAILASVQAALRGEVAPQSVPIILTGTPFQRRVWRYLQEIPHGQTRSYSEVAHAIGSPKAVRAVAKACAANRHAVLVPCHRVIRKDSSQTPFRWGAEVKTKLLCYESSLSKGVPY